MNYARSVSFLNAVKTIDAAKEHLEKSAKPGVIIHLWNPDRPLFAVCTQSELDSLQEELNQAKKDKQP